MSTILRTSPVQEKTTPQEAPKGFTNALLYAYQQIVEALEGQKKDQMVVLEAMEASIAVQQQKNEQLNELDFFLAHDVKAVVAEDWKKLTDGEKDQYRFYCYCMKNHIPVAPFSEEFDRARTFWSTLSEQEKDKLVSAQETFEFYSKCQEPSVQKRLADDKFNNEVMIKNEEVTKQRDYITNQIIIQQQKQQVLQAQSQTTVSSTSQSTGLAESLMGVLKTLAEQICYKVL